MVAELPCEIVLPRAEPLGHGLQTAGELGLDARHLAHPLLDLLGVDDGALGLERAGAGLPPQGDEQDRQHEDGEAEKAEGEFTGRDGTATDDEDDVGHGTQLKR